MKKAATTIAKKAVTTAVNTPLAAKVKEEVEQRMSSYKKKIALLALELGFFVLGFNFLVLGIVGIISKHYPEELILLIVGFALILIGIIFSKNLQKHS